MRADCRTRLAPGACWISRRRLSHPVAPVRQGGDERKHGPEEAAMARKWWTLAAVCTGVFMLLLDITIVNVALPDIQRAFHASLSDLQWTIDAYALTLAAFLLTAGSLADLLGRRLLFATGLSIFTAGSLACGLADGPPFLGLPRARQGGGGPGKF